MKSKGKYLYSPFYFMCMLHGGVMPVRELDVYDNPELLIMKPTHENMMQLDAERKSIIYWGSDSIDEKRHEFTTLRQNIVLFLAAMNNEL